LELQGSITQVHKELCEMDQLKDQIDVIEVKIGSKFALVDNTIKRMEKHMKKLKQSKIEKDRVSKDYIVYNIGKIKDHEIETKHKIDKRIEKNNVLMAR